MLDTHLDFLDTDITSKCVYLQDVLKTSSRYVFKMSSRHVFKTSSRSLQHINFWRHLQDVLREVLKTSWRRLERRKIVTLKTCWRRRQDMSWRHLQDVLKTNKFLLGYSLAFFSYLLTLVMFISTTFITDLHIQNSCSDILTSSFTIHKTYDCECMLHKKMIIKLESLIIFSPLFNLISTPTWRKRNLHHSKFKKLVLLNGNFHLLKISG